MPQVPDVLQKSDFAEVQKNKDRMRKMRIRGKYCLFLLFLLQLVTSNSRVLGQRDSAAVLGFTSGYDIVSISGPGWASGADSGDLLVELKSKSTGDEPLDFEKILLMRVHKGAYQLIAENEGLVMDPAMLGSAGSSSIYLLDSALHVDYNLGSNSSFSRISISFKKNARDQYLFKEYRSTTSHYGEEDLFARVLITENPGRPLPFSEASEAEIMSRKVGSHTGDLTRDNDKDNDKDNGKDNGQMKRQAVKSNLDEPSIAGEYKKKEKLIYKMMEKMTAPEYQLISYAIGDLNGDLLTRDALLLMQKEEEVTLRLLLENKDGSYSLKAENNQLLLPYYPAEGRPIQNVRLVIKNTYFSVEQRLPTTEMDYEHRYLTFHYSAYHEQFLLHRYDVERYEGFNEKPIGVIVQKYPKDFGELYFSQLAAPPNTFIYDEQNTVINGLVIQKTVDIDANGSVSSNEGNAGDSKQLTISGLQFPYAVNVQPPPFTKQSAQRLPRESDLSWVQLLTENRSIDLHEFLNKKVRMTGKFLRSSSKSHVTPVVFVVHGVEPR